MFNRFMKACIDVISVMWRNDKSYQLKILEDEIKSKGNKIITKKARGLNVRTNKENVYELLKDVKSMNEQLSLDMNETLDGKYFNFKGQRNSPVLTFMSKTNNHILGNDIYETVSELLVEYKKLKEVEVEYENKRVKYLGISDINLNTIQSHITIIDQVLEIYK